MATTVAGVPPYGRGRGRGRGLRAASVQKPGPTATTQSIPLKSNAPAVTTAAATSQKTKAPVVTPATAKADSISDDVSKVAAQVNKMLEKSKTDKVSRSPETSTTNIPASVNKPDTPTTDVDSIIKRMETLSESEVMKTILLEVELIKNQETVEDLVKSLCEKSLLDPHFALIATKLTSKMWDNASLHTFVRNPLLKLTQQQYMNRTELRKEKKYYGLCVYVCELFRYLRVKEKPLKPVGDAVIQLLKELVDKNSKPTDEDVFYFYQELENAGSVIEECIPEKMEELINIARQMVISSSLLPSMRCRLVQLIELHAAKWNMTDELKIMYDDMQQDLMSEGK